MVDEKVLQTELNYFNKQRQEWLNTYENQYALVKGEELIGTYTTEAEAYKAGLEKVGNQPFLIKQVVKEDKEISYPALSLGVTNVRF